DRADRVRFEKRVGGADSRVAIERPDSSHPHTRVVAGVGHGDLSEGSGARATCAVLLLGKVHVGPHRVEEQVHAVELHLLLHVIAHGGGLKRRCGGAVHGATVGVGPGGITRVGGINTGRVDGAPHVAV